MTEVRTTIKGPLRVRIIDGTRNHNQFEHQLTTTLACALVENNVHLESITFALTAGEFLDALERDGDFSCLLLVTHGEVPLPPGDSPTHAQVGDTTFPWLLLGKANADLYDKLVLLGVCGGFCPDSIWSLVTNDQHALVLVASDKAVSGDDIQRVFPRLLDLVAWKQDVSPEDILGALNKADPARKFRAYSGVGFIRDK